MARNSYDAWAIECDSCGIEGEMCKSIEVAIAVAQQEGIREATEDGRTLCSGCRATPEATPGETT